MSSVLDIAKSISRFSKESGNIEIEARFRSSDGRKTIPISEMDFEYLYDTLSVSNESSREVTTDYYKEGSRITELKGDYYLTTKEEIFSQILKTFDKSIKFSVSREEKTKTDFNPFEVIDMKREKERYTFLENNSRIDLTKVITTFGDQKPELNFEFEIEVSDPKLYKPEQFSETVIKYFELYDRHSKDIFLFCNLALSNNTDENEKGISYDLVSRPRDLLKEDLTSSNSILQGYTVSVKADGVQFFLVVYKTGVYLVNQKGKMTRLCELLEEYKELENSIFAGEVIDNHTTDTNFSQIYLPFDTIYYQGSFTADMDYTERIDKLKSIHELEFKCKGFNLLKVKEKKIFYLGTTNQQFYSEFRKCYQEKKKIFYKDDGYIFTPNKGGYLTSGQLNRNYKNLKRFPDVCKFKPLEKRSIDFRVRDGNVYVYLKGKEIIFKEIEYKIDDLEKFEGKIVEFFPVMENEEVVYLKPERIRSDKTRPNTLDVAKELVFGYREKNPLTEKTFLGEDTVLMRNFNNFYIKRGLISQMEGYVVDIGFGKGGDIPKYLRNKKIIKVMGVEPNPGFYTESERRATLRKSERKISRVDGLKGEDSEKVEKEFLKVFPSDMSDGKMIISFMISLSFFWESRETLASLSKTIHLIDKRYKERGGKHKTEIVFYTIDGYKVEKFFQERDMKPFDQGSIKMKIIGENQVLVDIGDSKTVFNQLEYLVKLDQFYSMAGLKEIYNHSPRVVGILMSPVEEVYLSLHTYGKAVVERDLILPNSMERLPVDTKEGVIKSDGTILAFGEDEIDSVLEIDENVYRIGTIDDGKSLQHSFLKLTNEEYRNSDYYERVRLASQMEFSEDLDDFSTSQKIGIKVYESDSYKLFGNEYQKWILLYKTRDGTYEPLIYLKEETVYYTFKKESFLV